MARKKALPAPDTKYILATYELLKAEYKDQDESIDRMRHVREMTQPSGVPEELRLVDVEVLDPTVSDEIGRVSAAMSINPPTLKITSNRIGSDAEDNATLRREWTQEVLRECGSRRPGIRHMDLAIDNCCGDGGAWTKVVFARDIWEERYRTRLIPTRDVTENSTPQNNDAPETADSEEATEEELSSAAIAAYDKKTEDAKKQAGPPFVVDAVDPRVLYPLYAGLDIAEMFEVTERPLHTTLRNYRCLDQDGDVVPDNLGQGVPKETYSAPGATCTFIEHWDPTWVTYTLLIGGGGGSSGSGYQIKQFKHGYGQVPYFPGFGQYFGYWRNRKVGWGVAETKRWLVEYRSYLMTVHANIAARDAFVPIIRQRGPNSKPSQLGEDGQAKSPETWNLREILDAGPDEKYQAFPVPPEAESLKNELERVGHMIDQLNTPRVTSQIGSGDMSGAGFAISQVIAETKIAQNPYLQHLAGMLDDVTRFIWKLVRTKVKETVWVRRSTGKPTKGGTPWLGAGPDDLTDEVGIEWDIDPERPNQKIVEERYWGERMKNGTASAKQAIEAMGDNYNEVSLQRDYEAMLQTDWYQQYRDQYVLQKAGRGDLLVKAAANRLAQGGQLQNANAPGGETTPLVTGPNAETPAQQLNIRETNANPDQGRLASGPNAPAAPPTSEAVGNTPGAVVPQNSAAPMANLH